MNKLLLLALILLLIVLAFGMGLFSKDDTKSLTQYVPESVERLFSDDKGDKTSESEVLKHERVVAKAEDLIKEESLEQLSEVKEVVESVEKDIEVVEEEKPVVTDSSVMTVDTKGKSSSLSTMIEIPDSLIKELQNDLLLDDATSELKKAESDVIQVDSENEELQQKFEALTAEFNSRSDVLKEIENQIKNLNN